MNLVLRQYQSKDLSFLKEMLYEAIYWRRGPDTPSLLEAVALPELRKDIHKLGDRDGDMALIAWLDEDTPVGVAWFRCWKKEDAIRGYVDDDIPILAIAVKEQFRKQGIGAMLIDGLVQGAWNLSIPQISLCVSKDNFALKLYKAKGFMVHTDLGHSFTMVLNTK